MKASKRIATLVAASALVLTPIPVAVAQPVAQPTPVATVATPGEAVAAAEAAGMTPQQARELGRMVQADPAIGRIIGSLLSAFQGAVDRVIPYLESLIPSLPPMPPMPTTSATQPKPTIPTTTRPTATYPEPTAPPSTLPPRPTTTYPEPSAPPTTRPTTTTPRPTTTATQPSPTIPTTTKPTTPTTPPPPPGCGVRSGATNPDAFAQGIFDLVNDYRRANGLRPMYRNLSLEGVAKGWSDTMAVTNIPAHNPNLKSQVPSCNRGVGENVGAGTGQQTPQKIFDNWRNSPAHNTNMLRQDLTDVGIGVSSNGFWTYATMVFAVM